jgi:hypothetical protein
MITVYCALYQEAQGFIHAFQLKKETGQRHFQVFSNEEAKMRVVITGVGAVAAAAAVAELSTCYPPGEQDMLVNFGSCAAAEGYRIGQVFLCSKITEMGSGRTFYPDMLYHHPFAEASIESAPKVMTREALSGVEGLCDMEAAAVYQAGNYYYGPHRMLFVKVVTDHGAEERFNLNEQLRAAGEQLSSYVGQLRRLCDEESESVAAKHVIRQQAAEDAKWLGGQLHCSVTMEAELTQLLLYCRLTGKDYAGMIKAYRSRGLLPAKDKREGKKRLEELKADLL